MWLLVLWTLLLWAGASHIWSPYADGRIKGIFRWSYRTVKKTNAHHTDHSPLCEQTSQRAYQDIYKIKVFTLRANRVNEKAIRTNYCPAEARKVTAAKVYKSASIDTKCGTFSKLIRTATERSDGRKNGHTLSWLFISFNFVFFFTRVTTLSQWNVTVNDTCAIFECRGKSDWIFRDGKCEKCAKSLI